MARSGITWGIGSSGENDRLATAIAGLGKAFEPPSGSDIYGYAKGASERADLARKNAAYELMAGDPTVGKLGAALIAATGNSSALGDLSKRQLYNDAAAMGPGADIGALDAKVYAINGNYGQTRQGNTQSQDASIRQALGVQGLQNQGALALERIKPVTLGEGQSYTLSPEEAARRGIPQTGLGVVKAAEGSSVRLPDGSTFNGPEKADRDSLKAGGYRNYRANDGRQGTAKIDPIRGWVDTQTGEKIPPGAITFGEPSAGMAPKVQNYKRADGTGGVAQIGPDGRAVDATTQQPLGPNDQLQADIPGKDKTAGEVRSEKNAAGQAERFIKIQTELDAEGNKAQKRLAVAGELARLQQMFPQGTGAEYGLAIKKLAGAMGLPISDTASAQETFRVIAQQLVAESASLFGSNPSNADREAVERMKPNPTNLAATNAFQIEQIRRESEQSTNIQRMARAYALKHGALDDNFLKEVDDYRVAHPIFEKEIRQDPQASARLDAEIAARQGGATVGANGAPATPQPIPPGAVQTAPAQTPGDGSAPNFQVPQGYETPKRAPDGMWYTRDPATGRHYRVS